MHKSILAILWLLSLPLAGLSYAESASPQPLARAHAHNDYLHPRPLLDALDHGFNSVEADIFLVSGRLLVAHNWFMLRPSRSLQALYLDPLAERAEQNKGVIHSNAPPFTLLIDIKTDGEKTYKTLHELLQNYTALLSVTNNRAAAVKVIISGNRPKQLMLSMPDQLAGFDGRLSDLDSELSPQFMPMISDKWSKHFSWNGIGAMPAGEKQKLISIVNQVHNKGRLLRFWATPEQPDLWRELVLADVDYINTDKLAGLKHFLTLQR